MTALEASALDPATIRAIAREVARLTVPGGGLLTASEVAAAFKVTRGWVYAHADELGAIRPSSRNDSSSGGGEQPQPRPLIMSGPASRCFRSDRRGRGVLSKRSRR